MVSWRMGINYIFKNRNALAWAPDQQRMNRNANNATFSFADQRRSKCNG